MFNRRIGLLAGLAVAFMAPGGANASGQDVLNSLRDAAYMNTSPTFSMRYGNCPKPLNGSFNGQMRKSGVAAHKRAQRKLRNIRARASKRRHGR